MEASGQIRSFSESGSVFHGPVSAHAFDSNPAHCWFGFVAAVWRLRVFMVHPGFSRCSVRP